MNGLRRKLSTLLYLTSGAVGYTLFFEFFYCWMRFGNPVPFSAREMLLSIWYNFIPIFTLMICNYLLVFKLTRGKRPIVSVAICLLLSVLVLVSVGMIFTLFTHYPVDYAGTVFCDLLILAALESIYYVRYSSDILRRHARQQQETLIYKYEALKAQINPHFLFNSLNILYSFIPPDLKDAREYVLHLSRIYRFTLNHNDRSMVSLDTELDFLNSYIRILQIRYDNNLKINIKNLPAETHYIIPYSLQMLVENVTKHNFISSEFPMSVDIDFSEKGITVTNPIRLKEADVASTKFGLSYLKHLYAYNGKEFKIKKDDTSFQAFVPYLNSPDC